MKHYLSNIFEKKWEEYWENNNQNIAKDFDIKNKYYILEEFPYCSGEGLHIGHAFTNTIGDIIARKKRMEGFNVLHPMGWDSFGLPTENSALRSNINPFNLTKRNTKRFRLQNIRLGNSYDWNREIDTSDPNYFKWTQWIFQQLFKHGLAYKQLTQVGWCPSCKIILANEEIVTGKCERCHANIDYRMQKQWLLRITAYADRLNDELKNVDYPEYVVKSQQDWIGRKEWTDITYPIEGSNEKITVSTTRPDTNFGATFIVVAPEHSLVASLLNSKCPACAEASAGRQIPNAKLKEIKKYLEVSKKKSELERISEKGEKTGVFTGLYAINKLNNYRLPIWITDFVLMSVGTGAVVGVPGHDRRDFDFAQKFGLPVIRVVVGKDGDRSPITSRKKVFENEGVAINSGLITNLNTQKASEKIISYLEKMGWGKRVVRYHLRDWIFSRQHYWGEPIPMIYCEACAKKGISWWDSKEYKIAKRKHQKVKIIENWKLPARRSLGAGGAFGNSKRSLVGWFPLPEDQLPLELPKVEKYQPTDTGESPLANVREWVQTKCPNCGKPARRETDTMPNWAGSSWYYLAFCMAKNFKNKEQRTKNKGKDIFSTSRKELTYWLPVDLYLGGAEHTTLHLLYSRFWHKFLNDLGLVPGKEPYAARRQHGVILGSDGQRMSKSRGNIINPSLVIEKFGADTLRIYLMFMGPYDSTMPWDTKGVEGSYRFLCRIWRLFQEHVSQKEIKNDELVRRLHQTIKKVGTDIDNLKHNTAISALMEFVNSWSKAGSISAKEAEIFLRLLAPFAPHIAEELWQALINADFKADKRRSKDISVNRQTNQRKSAFKSVHSQSWPKYDPKLVEEEMITIVVQINGKLRGQVEVRSTKLEVRSEIEKLAKKNPQVAKYLEGKKIIKSIFVPGRLINFVV